MRTTSTRVTGIPLPQRILIAVCAAALLTGCSRAEEQTNAGEGTSTASSTSSGSTSTASSSSTKPAPSTPARLPAPTGTAVKMTITNPDGHAVLSTGINPYQGADAGLFNPGEDEAAWWNRGRFGAPGATPTSVLAGHVTFDGLPDVFWDLHKTVKGAKVTVAYDDGTTRTWKVSEVLMAPKEDVANTKKDAGKKVWSTEGLRIITCDTASGTRADGHTRGNTVVLADPVA